MLKAPLAGREGIGPGPPLLDDALALARELRNLLAQGRVAGIEDVDAGHGTRLPEVRFDEVQVEEQDAEALGRCGAATPRQAGLAGYGPSGGGLARAVPAVEEADAGGCKAGAVEGGAIKIHTLDGGFMEFGHGCSSGRGEGQGRARASREAKGT